MLLTARSPGLRRDRGPLIVGVLLTAVGGVFAGLVMGLSPRAEWLGLPLFIVLQASPSAAIVPLITFIYGIGFTAKVFAVVLLSAPVIVLNSYRGIANTPRSLLEMSNAFLASRWQRIWKVVIPAGSGVIFAGLRLGLAQSSPAPSSRAHHHPDRHRRPDHLQPFGRRLSLEVRGHPLLILVASVSVKRFRT